MLAASGLGARAGTTVDLSLVLAVDVSASMEPVEQELQRAGFIEAFRSPALHDAVRHGVLGRIAVTYLNWAGEAEQSVVIPWTIIEQPPDATMFADRLSQAPPHSAGFTSISGAIESGVRQLEDSHVESTRQVIDISGDGPNNKGRPVARARRSLGTRDHHQRSANHDSSAVHLSRDGEPRRLLPRLCDR
jgi:hypothetical protein